jgi:membrane-associated phospholipid phosphatase
MPSLHVGWAVWAAWALYPLLNRPGRWIVIAYTAGTTIVVVATGNHWILDAAAGAAIVWLAITLTRLLAQATERRQRARLP